MSITLAREVAYDSFIQVMKKNQKPEDVLEKSFSEHGNALRRLDRNFIKEMLYGSLRWYSKIYWILQNTSRRNLDECTPQIQSALVMGTYQIYYMDRVPDRAAVNESVEYVRKRGQANACTFVNGILRQISRRAEYFAKPDKVKNSAEYLALQFAHPKWIVDRWCERFKFEKMETILAANNQPPPHSVRVNSMMISFEDMHNFQQSLLKQERTHTERRPLRSCLRCKEFPQMDVDSGFAEGYFTIQDEAAQLIGYLVSPEPGQTVVDACCGPGGKLTHVFELGRGEITLIGLDRSDDRLQKAKETATRLKFADKIQFELSDFRNWKPNGPVNKVLLDAPCSGLGVLRRHPEGKWQKTIENVKTMISLQKDLLTHAFDMLAPGGEVIYSVCSFEPEETEDQLAWILDRYGDKIEKVSPVSRVPDYYKKYVTRDNLLLIYSGNQDDMDGFGAFIIRKKG